MNFDPDAPPPPDHNLHAELIRFSEWGRRPILWLWDRIFARRKVSLLVDDQPCATSGATRPAAATP